MTNRSQSKDPIAPAAVGDLRPGRSERARAERTVARELRKRLELRGFTSEGGAHFVRQRKGVTEVVEAQHSIYGSRVTANLGLDLGWLRPLIRWIPRPDVGPHAHDCVRWIRVGLVDNDRGDRWWSYEVGDAASLAAAADALAERVDGPGLDWLQREGEAHAFLRHAEKCVERSRSRVQPEGGYLELRLLAAVLAWQGDFSAAQEVCRLASALWEEERDRLAMARKIYRRRHPEAPARLPGVPNLQRELERITEPTTGVRLLRRAGAEGPKKP